VVINGQHVGQKFKIASLFLYLALIYLSSSNTFDCTTAKPDHPCVEYFSRAFRQSKILGPRLVSGTSNLLPQLIHCELMTVLNRPGPSKTWLSSQASPKMISHSDANEKSPMNGCLFGSMSPSANILSAVQLLEDGMTAYIFQPEHHTQAIFDLNYRASHDQIPPAK